MQTALVALRTVRMMLSQRPCKSALIRHAFATPLPQVGTSSRPQMHIRKKMCRPVWLRHFEAIG